MARSLRFGQRHPIATARKLLAQKLWRGAGPLPKSLDYLKWRRQFLQQRLRLGLWLALFWHSLVSSDGLYRALFEFEVLKAAAMQQYGDVAIAYDWRSGYLAYYGGAVVLLLLLTVLHRTPWGRQRGQLIFLLFAGALGGLFAQLVLALFQIPEVPSTLVFLVMAVFVPVHWRLHLIYQLLAIAFYALVYPLVGLAVFRVDASDLYARETIIEVVCVSLVSVLSVYLYERLKRSEFEAHRRLQTFLRSVCHDLQTPVMGSSVVLKSLLEEAEAASGTVAVSPSVLRPLLQGNQRQLALIRALADTHAMEERGLVLHRESLALRPMISSALDDLEHELVKKRVQLINHISADLPPVDADAHQLWRVLSNLVGNALKHNPHGIELVLDADVISPGRSPQASPLWSRLSIPSPQVLSAQEARLLCAIKDSGNGIPVEQVKHLFEPYSRGPQARYMPGLGLGLYLCKQIVAAHGGEIGVVTQMGTGTIFWFTLPVDKPQGHGTAML
ncbi:MAG: HAMP domain-containing sensor histidine kinase [Cyanobacteria bacterium P01_A01_bin.135]